MEWDKDGIEFVFRLKERKSHSSLQYCDMFLNSITCILADSINLGTDIVFAMRYFHVFYNRTAIFTVYFLWKNKRLNSLFIRGFL